MNASIINNHTMKAAALICAASLLLCAAAAPAAAAGTTERIANRYAGSRDYLDVLFNIDFQDIGSSWARDAIYESGALGIVKGFGSAVYGGGAALTKSQAIGLAIRAAGLESDAQIAGEAIEVINRAAGYAPSGAEAIWANGSLKIAADIGLIDANDYEAAMGAAAAQALSAFRRDAPAQRQEFAYWIARALDISPVRGQEALFTMFNDWGNIDSLYVPYVEAILRERIMSGDLLGNFSPRDAITREQAAQVIKNASGFVYAKNGFTATTGTIESISTDAAAVPEGSNAEVVRAVYYIRNQLGQLDIITTRIAVGDSAGAASAARRETGLVVNAGGSLEDETALRAGDRIRYIAYVGGAQGGSGAQGRAGGAGRSGRTAGAQGSTNSQGRSNSQGNSGDADYSSYVGDPGFEGEPGYTGEIRYIEILAQQDWETEGPRAYVLAQIDNIDHVNRRIGFTQIFPLEDASATGLRRAAEAPQELLRLSADYIYSENVSVKSNGAYTGVDALAVGMVAIIGIENYRSLFYIETVQLSYHLGEPGIARGIIEENNPALGFVSMYSESGDRTGVRSLGRDGEKPELMIYNYSDLTAVDVRKDGAAASIESLSAGDSAFVRIDPSGELTAISAVTNYKVSYGTIVSVLSDSAIIRYEWAPDDVYSISIGADVLYFMDYRVVDKSAMTPGSSVRVLSQDLGGATIVREITIMHGGDRGLVGNIYKAVLSRLDETSKKAVIYNVQKLVKGQWVWVDRKGFDTIYLNADTRIYAGNASMTVSAANKMLRDVDVYIAAKNDYGGIEVAAQINAMGLDDKEQLYDSVVGSVRRTTGVFGLVNGPTDIAAGEWSIVVKDGKLVSGAVIEPDDLVYVVASRGDQSGRMRAEVVEIGIRADNTGIHIYRGRISNIVPTKEFTLESFSELDLKGTEWKYANTPKTLSLTFDTLFLTESGITPLSMFDSRGQYDYTDPARTVYVLSDGTDALAVSTAPYGIANIRGVVVSIEGRSFDEDGKTVAEPSGITLSSVSYYDREKYAWTQRKGDTAVTFNPDTLVIKNGKPVAASAIAKSDAVRVIKADVSVAGAGYIVIIEN